MKQIVWNRENKIRLGLLVLLPCLVAAGAWLYVHRGGFASILPPCPLRAKWGVLCPGCGMTRALLSLFRGHIIKSFSYNPLAVIGASGAVLCYLEQWSKLWGRGMRLLPRKKVFYIVLILLLLFYYVLRNVVAFA